MSSQPEDPQLDDVEDFRDGIVRVAEQASFEDLKKLHEVLEKLKEASGDPEEDES